jgi:hypothetical protein
MSSVMEIAMKDMGMMIEMSQANMKMLPGPIVNVSGYGAVADGVTDVTAAVQKAIDFAVSNGMRTIFFPHGGTGQYYVTALTDTHLVDFVGDNSSFVGGYVGTITDFGAIAALKADFTQLENDHETRVVKPTQEITPPTGLGHSPDFTIPYIKKDGEAVVSGLDLESMAPIGNECYVDVNIGINTNDGLTPGTPFKSLAKAITIPTATVVHMAAGVYNRANGTNGNVFGRDITIKVTGGRAVIGSHDDLTWALSGSYTYTYEATRSSIESIFDTTILDENGDYTALTLQTSIANVNANPGSYYSDGTKIYVRTRDSRVVTNTVRAYLAVNNIKNVGNFKTYLENVDVEGGLSNVRIENVLSTDNAKVYAKNCTFKYSGSDNAVKIIGADSIFESCIAAQGYTDGFNYHLYNNHAPIAVEINCIGRSNGARGVAATNNGSSIHDGGTIVRVNGKYHGNSGPNIADVLGSKSWNVAVEAYGSLITTSQGVNFYNDGDMWLDGCVTHNSTYDLATEGTLSVRNLLTEGENNVISGSIVSY